MPISAARPSRRRVIGAGFAVIGLLVGTGLAAPAAIARPNATRTVLQHDVDALHAAGVTGVLAEVVDHGRPSYARAGSAFRGTHIPVPTNGRFRIGSITKTFVATIIMQLVGAGRLSLEDSVEKWLPGVIDGNGYDGSRVTIRELLQHTSGIFDYTEDATFQDTLGSAAAFDATRFKHYSPQDVIAIALAHPPLFPPGTGWHYASTNYVLLGQVIKAVTGHTWVTELYRRIILPLHLTGTSVPGDNPLLPLPAIGGDNIYTQDPANRTYTDTTVANLSWGDAAGSLVSTTADVNRFYRALFDGELVSPALLAQMKTSSPVAPPSVGLGFGFQTLDCGVEINGFEGTVLGYDSYVLSNDDGTKTITLFIGTTTFTEQQFYDDSHLGAFNVVEHAFCP
jgi:D-alanyl-D-alanine carboxypeptidase